MSFTYPDHVFMVAELSANHGGSLDVCLETVRAAAAAGADAIKLQTYTADGITLDCRTPPFQIKDGTLWDGTTLHDLYLEAQTPWEWHAPIQAEADRARTNDGASLSGMKSVREFSEVWSKISAQRQVAQALDRGPANAGPLNSHRLMLRSLSLMQSLSPDYLRRFLSQTDSLLWLEQASTKRNGSTAKPVRKSRSKR